MTDDLPKLPLRRLAVQSAVESEARQIETCFADGFTDGWFACCQRRRKATNRDQLRSWMRQVWAARGSIYVELKFSDVYWLGNLAGALKAADYA